MTARLNPYISFKDNARAAMEFYREVFGGELRLNTFGETGDPDAPGANLIMHGQLETPDGYLLMASDTPSEMEWQPGANISVSLSGPNSADGDRLRAQWQRLSADSAVIIPFEKQIWGDEFGMCTDKFGVNWMVNVIAD